MATCMKSVACPATKRNAAFDYIQNKKNSLCVGRVYEKWASHGTEHIDVVVLCYNAVRTCR
jgi:hypothetical protein